MEATKKFLLKILERQEKPITKDEFKRILAGYAAIGNPIPISEEEIEEVLQQQENTE